MLITLGFYPGDLDQAERLASWIKELGCGAGHRMIVARDIRTLPPNPFEDCGFDRVDEIVITNDVWNAWPQSANNVFRQIVTYIELVDKAPYHLWIEPDVVPLTREAFDVLEAEYRASGKPFMGDRVAVDNVPVHMSGVGIYPGLLTHFAGQAKLAVETAWDVFSADQIVPQMHETGLISHAWKHPVFEDWAAVEREIFAIKPDCVLFHASKDGSLIRLLREKRNPMSTVTREPTPGPRGGSEEPQAALGVIEAGRSSPSGYTGDSSERDRDTSGGGQIPQVLCDILIKSHPPDYPLLKYSLHSVWKFATGFENVVLVVPEGEYPNFVNKTNEIPGNLKVIKVPETPEANGYLFQQTIKASAHQFTVSEYVLHTDSDTVFTTTVTPNSFLRDGKPIWFVTPYGATHSPWKASTEKFIGHPVDLEFMRRLPMFIPRKVHEKADAFCLEKHGISLGEYIMGQTEFSEFNALGAVAWEFFYSDIYWFDTTQFQESAWPPLVALQTWSHAPFEEAQTKFEAILGTPWQNQEYWRKEREKNGDESTTAEPHRPWACPAEYAKEDEQVRPAVTPWQNQLESELEIKRLVKELRAFQTSPAHTNRVRLELRLARVVPGRKAIKGMAKRRRRLG